MEAHPRSMPQRPARSRRNDKGQQPERRSLRKACTNEADRHEGHERHASNVEKLDQLLGDEIGKTEIEQEANDSFLRFG
jgi:hypothetical protein